MMKIQILEASIKQLKLETHRTFMTELKLSDWTDIAQAIAAIIGIFFLVLNLRRTNRMIKLQSDALRSSTMPRLKADVKYGHLPESTQKEELPPLSIHFTANTAYNITLTFESNEFIDVSPTYRTYDLRHIKDNQLFFENLEIGNEIIIRSKVKPNAPSISDEFENLEEYNSVMKLYAQAIKIDFQDISGHKYSQTIIWEGANFDKVIVLPVVFL